MRPCRAARGAKPIACGQSFAPRGVNRMEPDPSSAMHHAAQKHMSRRCAWPPARTPRTRRTAETASRASSSALVCSPKRCDDVCSHGAARARRSCREAWSRVAHSKIHFFVVVRPSMERLPSILSLRLRFRCRFRTKYRSKAIQRTPTSPKKWVLVGGSLHAGV